MSSNLITSLRAAEDIGIQEYVHAWHTVHSGCSDGRLDICPNILGTFIEAMI